MDSRIKLITAGCFLLCWFALFYVCVLFRSGDLAALEKAWYIRWFFVEKFDAEAVGVQRGRSFRKMIASVRAENVKKFEREHSMAGMRSRRPSRGAKERATVRGFAYGVGRWFRLRRGGSDLGAERGSSGSSDSSVGSPPDYTSKRALGSEQEKREGHDHEEAEASTASTASAVNGPRQVGWGTTETRAAEANTSAAVVPVMPESGARHDGAS